MIEFILIAGISSIAARYAMSRQLNVLRDADTHFPMPASSVILQGIIQCVLGAGLGAFLQAITGFAVLGLLGSIANVLIITLLGFLGHIILYYVVFRPRLPKHSIQLTERIRLGMGIFARVLQGGIVEEVQFRWGLMSGVAALGTFLAPIENPILVAFAIGVAALLFALIHLVGAQQIGLARDNSEVAFIIVDNVWGGLIFGWLFWQHGLLAAMLSHALFHIAWVPIEKITHRDAEG